MFRWPYADGHRQVAVAATAKTIGICTIVSMVMLQPTNQLMPFKPTNSCSTIARCTGIRGRGETHASRPVTAGLVEVTTRACTPQSEAPSVTFGDAAISLIHIGICPSRTTETVKTSPCLVYALPASDTDEMKQNSPRQVDQRATYESSYFNITELSRHNKPWAARIRQF